MTTRWSFPTRILFGVGTVSEVGREVVQLGGGPVLIVSDPGVAAAGLLEPVTAALAAAGVSAQVFTGVSGNPVEEQVRAGHQAYVAAGARAIVALGGGSPMDVAKVVALRVNHHRPLADYDDAKGGDALVTEAVPPIVAIPTTAGTGSEVGRSGVVTLEQSGRKTVIFAPNLLPAVAILDPEMTRTMPRFVTAATGYDALTHNVEAYLARGDHPMADGIAREGIRLAAGSLSKVVENGDDLAARGDMMKSAMMGAVAFQKGLGACHSLAHPLSTVCGLQHGLANALCLPEVVRFNLAVEDAAVAADVRARYAEVALLLDGQADADHCAGALEALRRQIGLPERLGDVDVAKADLERLADEAVLDGCHASGPRPCSRQDLLALYQACF